MENSKPTVMLQDMQKLLADLRNTTSSKEKIAILQSVSSLPQKNQEFIKFILKATYSPQENFFLKPIKDSYPMSNDDDLVDLGIVDALNMFKNSIRGNKARDFYHDFKAMCKSNNREFEAELLDLVLNKDLAAGIATDTINKVFAKLIPEQPYMRCSLVKQITNPAEWFENAVIYSQEKMDGMFVNINVNNDGSIEFLSRSGTVFPHSQPLDDLVRTMNHFEKNYQYHGELLIMDKNSQEFLPREIGNGILNSVAKNSNKGKQFNYNEHQLSVVLWDMIPIDLLNNPDIVSAPYHQRFAQLNKVIDEAQSPTVKMVETNIFDNLNDAQKDFKEKLAQGKEGVCWKLGNMVWKDTTSRQIIKLKNTFEVDLRITGFTEGNGKNAQYFGSIQTESEDGLLKVDVSGFSDEMRKAIAAKKDEYIGKIMSVKAANITQTNDNLYSLFLPRFAEFRYDKKEADSFHRIQQQYDESLSQYDPVEELRKKWIEKNKKSRVNRFKF